MAENMQDGGEANTSDLNAGFQQLVQGLNYLQEDLHLHEQEAARRMEAPLQQHEQRMAAMLQEGVSQFEEQLQQQDDAIYTLRKGIEEIEYWLEERAALMEQRGGSSARNGSGGTIEGGKVEQLEKRLEKMEEAIQKTLSWTPHRVAGAATRTAGQGSSCPEQTEGGGDLNQSTPCSLLGKRKK